MDAIIEKIKNEPVLVTSLITGVMGLLVAFNVPITEEQKAAIIFVVGAILAFVARQNVTPVNKLPEQVLRREN